MKNYNPQSIEKKWQAHWDENKTFKTTNKSDKKYYALDMFPYPSGSGLHVGHPEGYTATDIVSRYKRLNGFDVLHPIGWDAFGLPAEQYALKTNNHPAVFTQENIQRFKTQLKSLGFSFDWDKEIDTTDPEYYKITQWIFTKIYDAGLAEIRDIEVNWCEELGTVLANEEVLDGDNGKKVSEVGGFEVVKKPMKQWVLKITEYADKLSKELDEVNWPNSLISLQRNWIHNEDGSLHLRDWIFSRQRYWGEPFPVVKNDKGEVKIIKDLPVVLPEMNEFKPSGTGESPLANNKEWLKYVDEDGQEWIRETNTMPQWAGSSWYYIAYILKTEEGYLDIESPEAQELLKKWLPVDLYIGGQEHAVLHLLYARFWHKILFDAGVVPTKEPFFKLVNQGMILGPDGQKMSKSKGNVINPDDIVNEFGADTLRIYEMFMGPLEDTKPWSEKGVQGAYKWLNRAYRVFTEIKEGPSDIIESEFNLMVKGVTSDLDTLKFNTAISKMMVFINAVYKEEVITKSQKRDFAIMLSTIAPHIGEEMLSLLGEDEVAKQTWPTFDESRIIAEKPQIAVQVNGKLRGLVDVEDNDDAESLFEKARVLDTVIAQLEGKQVVKKIYVKGKIFNLVVK